jgi:hypothetical protein
MDTLDTLDIHGDSYVESKLTPPNVLISFIVMVKNVVQLPSSRL